MRCRLREKVKSICAIAVVRFCIVLAETRLLCVRLNIQTREVVFCFRLREHSLTQPVRTMNYEGCTPQIELNRDTICNITQPNGHRVL